MTDDTPARNETDADLPAAGVPHADRLTTLQHELRNLIDGTLRCLGVASRSLPTESVAASSAEIESVRKQLDVACGSMERMADMLHHGLRGDRGVFGYAGRRVTLAEAIEHAAEVTRPLAAAHESSVLIELSPEVHEVPAGAVYPAILNALRNSAEAVSLCGGKGCVEVRARVLRDRTVEIEVRDDAHGPPPGTEGRSIVFSHGYTTKPMGGGIGLSIAGEVAKELGGTAELRVGAGRKPGRPGSVFVLRYPLPGDDDDTLFGSADTPADGAEE